ncbi:MAG: hypothetical protein ACRBBM_18200 [Pseudomonadaceae bacterium]
MSDATFNSCRDAVAYALSHRKGPQAARPSHGRGPGGYRDAWDGSAVRACMVNVGIKPDSPCEIAMRQWALEGGAKPVELERMLRCELDFHGLLKRTPQHQLTRRSDLVNVTWTDPNTGAEVSHRGAAREDD